MEDTSNDGGCYVGNRTGHFKKPAGNHSPWFVKYIIPFPITTQAWSRLVKSYHLWWAGYHLFAAIEHLEKRGDSESAVLGLKHTFIYKYPPAAGGETR